MTWAIPQQHPGKATSRRGTRPSIARHVGLGDRQCTAYRVSNRFEILVVSAWSRRLPSRSSQIYTLSHPVVRCFVANYSMAKTRKRIQIAALGMCIQKKPVSRYVPRVPCAPVPEKTHACPNGLQGQVRRPQTPVYPIDAVSTKEM